MPGAKKPNSAQIVKRSTKLAIRVKQVLFSPDGSQFACATTEGLIIYSLQSQYGHQQNFIPVEITEDITIDNIIKCIKDQRFLMALLMALKMNDSQVIEKVHGCIPIE